jgi:hypothetical protein
MRVMFITPSYTPAGVQSSDDKRGNERRRDFASHNACSVSLDGCGKNEDLLPR